MSVFALTLSLFLVMNAFGAIPIFVSILSRFEVKKQRSIILREFLIALFILLAFNFFGDELLNMLGITKPVIGIGGGIILFIIGLAMIFPKKNDSLEMRRQEPFIVPLAMPLVAGPGTITTVLIYAEQMQNVFLMTLIILLAWLPSLIIVLMASNIKYLLGQKGLTALQRFGGMLICLIAVQMACSGFIGMVKDSFPRDTATIESNRR